MVVRSVASTADLSVARMVEKKVGSKAAPWAGQRDETSAGLRVARLA